MKKKFCILLTVALLFSVCFLPGCDSLNSNYNKYKPYISELRTDIYSYNDSDIAISVYSGVREKNFIADGKTSEAIDYSIINIIPELGVNSNYAYSYVAVINKVNYSGTMQRHPFDENYWVELEVNTQGHDFTIVIRCDTTNTEKTYSLKTERKDTMINYLTAFDIACKKLSDEIKTLYTDKTFNAEVFIRFIENPLNNNGGYYWYVAFNAPQNVVYAVLIDPTTEQIAAIRD